MKRGRIAWALSPLLLIALGCLSSHSQPSPSVPSYEPHGATMFGGTQLWGLYEVTIDAETDQAEIIPLRSAEVEVNVLKFLEDPALPPGIIISNLQINPPQVNCDVGIRHPFAGHPEYMGFTVRGVVLTNGTMENFSNPSIALSRPDELRLKNADGYIRWMNPREFHFDGTIFNYFPGKIGDPEGIAYNSTVNPYKLYADDLDAVSDNLDLDEENMSMFSDGALNWRHYDLGFGLQPFLRFQYAIVASTESPLNQPPEGPEDFPPGTVASEPWRVEVVELQNDLWFDGIQQGGELILQVLVRDFENADQDTVFIEAPDVLPRQEMELVAQDGNHLTFERSVTGIYLKSADSFEVLVAAVALDGEGYDGRLPGQELATYLLHEVSVSDEEPQLPDWPFYDDFENYDYVWTSHGGDWWGEAGGYMDAKGGGSCFEEDTGSDEENLNVSYVSSPPINVPESDDDLVIVFNHTIDVDPPEDLGHFAWDMCYVRLNGEQIFPTGGPLYEDNYYPWTFDPIKCWTSYYDWTESTFNLGTEHNGTTIQVEFVLDTYDYINNCDPPYFGWLIDDILVDFAD